MVLKQFDTKDKIQLLLVFATIALVIVLILQTNIFSSQTKLMHEEFETERRPWISGFEFSIQEDEILYSYQNFGKIPNTGGSLTFQVSDALITREDLEFGHTKSIPLQILMPDQKLTARFTGKISEVANMAKEGKTDLFLGVIFDYTYSNERSGKYGFIGKYNPTTDDFDIIDTWVK